MAWEPEALFVADVLLAVSGSTGLKHTLDQFPATSTCSWGKLGKCWESMRPVVIGDLVVSGEGKVNTIFLLL